MAYIRIGTCLYWDIYGYMVSFKQRFMVNYKIIWWLKFLNIYLIFVNRSVSFMFMTSGISVLCIVGIFYLVDILGKGKEWV